MKRNYWPLFFIGIFSFVFSMIIWTIYSATNTPVHEDKTFLKSYQDLNKDFNDVVDANQKFLDKYSFKLNINKSEFDLEFKDVFLSQRVIEERSIHKDIFNMGDNFITISIKDKNTDKIIEDVKIAINITRPTNDNDILDFTNEDFIFENGVYENKFKLPFKGNWNITGTFKIGNDTGYFFIKSNAI